MSLPSLPGAMAFRGCGRSGKRGAMPMQEEVIIGMLMPMSR